MLTRGRILRAPENVRQLERPPVSRRGHRSTEAEILAKERARALVDVAETQAQRTLRDAENEARALRSRALEEGRAEGARGLAAAWVALKMRETQADQLALDRTVRYATLLAERILGRALRDDPTAIRDLAAEALAEARAAERIILHAHPEDAKGLGASITALDPEKRVYAVVADDALARGDLRIETPSGTIEAHLGSGLTRLAAELREALSP